MNNECPEIYIEGQELDSRFAIMFVKLLLKMLFCRVYLCQTLREEAFPQISPRVFFCPSKLFFNRIHVRRSDKINNEAAFHSLEEYMYWVDLYFKKISLKETLKKKNVYLATDDHTVLAEAMTK